MWMKNTNLPIYISTITNALCGVNDMSDLAFVIDMLIYVFDCVMIVKISKNCVNVYIESVQNAVKIEHHSFNNMQMWIVSYLTFVWFHGI